MTSLLVYTVLGLIMPEPNAEADAVVAAVSGPDDDLAPSPAVAQQPVVEQA